MIRMEQEYEDVRFLVGDMDVLCHMEHVRALPLFSKSVVSFLSRLSEVLLHDSRAKAYGDVIAFAFWLRKASIEHVVSKYGVFEGRIGWGMAFHITPSNIPVQFAVSLVYALVAGNASVVRVSDKNFDRSIFYAGRSGRFWSESFPCCVHTFALSDIHMKVRLRISFPKCVISDSYGAGIRRLNASANPAPSRCVELGFADRYSIAIIDADAYLQMDAKVVARDFYIDTYYTDQNACSSTRLLLWTGDRIEEAKRTFWTHVQEEVSREYSLNDISGSEKLLRTTVLAAAHPGIREIRHNNALVRVELPELFEDVMDYKGNSGYFMEYHLRSMDELTHILHKQCQTITYLGKHLEHEIQEIIVQKGLKGGDRIVPMGHSLDLSFTWDGYDMPLTLSREVSSQ